MSELEQEQRNLELYKKELEHFFYDFAMNADLREEWMLEVTRAFCDAVEWKLEERYKRIEAELEEHGELEPW